MPDAETSSTRLTEGLPGEPLGRALRRAWLLSNPEYTALVTAEGAGWSRSRGLALTRWSGDRIEGRDGGFLYLKDRESGTLWSAGLQPVGLRPERYAASWRPGVVEIAREDLGIETRLEICVAPDAAIEIRRLTVGNASSRPREIEVTTYHEVVLDTPSATAAHPAFSKLFVQTEFDAGQGALLARRRPRGPGPRPPWMVHALHGAGSLEHETDRARFLGRGGSLARPCALMSSTPLSGTAGSVLDPVLCLRRVARLEPGESARFVSLLGAGDELGRSGGCRETLVRHGASPERPLVLVDARTSAVKEVLEHLLKAHRYWRSLGLDSDLLVICDDPARLPAKLRGGAEPGLRLLRAAEVPPGDLELLTASARFVVDGSKTVLTRPEPAELGEGEPRPPAPARPATGAVLEAPEFLAEPLLGFNGHGGFSEDGREYAIRITRDRDGFLRLPPRPWINVVANRGFGFLFSETGAGCTWSGNSREHRITPWFNDSVLDPHGEALYVRDEESGAYWSPLPGPAPGSGDYEMRHGFGYSRCRHSSEGLEQEVLAFVPARDPVKITRVCLVNASGRPRRLCVFAYQRLVLGVLPEEDARFVATELDGPSHALLGRNPMAGEFADRVAFSGVVAEEGVRSVHFTADRESFVGRHGDLERPAALTPARLLDGRTGAGLDPCFAEQVTLDLAPGQSLELSFLLGEGSSRAHARELLSRYREPNRIEGALEEVQSFWAETLTRVQVRTPAPAVDVMVNGWLLYQNLSCRIWGRSAHYQSGGAFGFRDQLQDATAFALVSPDLTRAQILLHASHQFVEGDVLHWWHPPLDHGLRTRFADDLLWLPYLTATYVRSTGDGAILDEEVGFLSARPLEEGEDEAFVEPAPAGVMASLYEHCCRAIDRSLALGPHGLPLFGTGDWNDGMNRVGREGRGESVWMGFFLCAVLRDFVPLCEGRRERRRASRYRRHREALIEALNDAGWDGEWYRRGYYDDGMPLGSRASDECKIDALAQAWAVLSGAAPGDRADQALDSVERWLISEPDRLIRLLKPPFDRTPHDPGYIKGYVPGVRENGGQYTHAALWVVAAMAERGRRDRAARLLEMLSPVSHALSPRHVGVYQVEPYVVAADVYGEAPHVGRGGWTWYTGSAGWMFRVALEWVLGLRIVDGDTLTVRPCIPDEWDGFEVRYRPGEDGTVYEVLVLNPGGKAAGVVAASVDGIAAAVEEGAARVRLERDGRTHRIEVRLG